MGSSKNLNTANAEFKTAWKALKVRTTPEQLAVAYEVMNIRTTAKGGELPHHQNTTRYGVLIDGRRGGGVSRSARLQAPSTRLCGMP